MPMDDSIQNEILRLRKEIERLQGLLDQRTTALIPAQTDAKSLHTNFEFLSDCCRYSENILSEEDVRKKWHFDAATWKGLGDNEALIEAIEAEKVRRIRNGSAKRERAQQLVVQAPDVLGDIMLDASASPKHRIDASKVLDTFAANRPGAAAEQDRFIIRIDLTAGGGEVLEFNKPLKPDPNDGEIIDATPQKALVPSTAEDDWKR
jgi:hypothetical protein